MRISDWSSDVCSSDLQTVIGTEGLDLDLAIERHQLRGGGIRLGTANIALAIQGLALQIADFDAIVVAQQQATDAGTGEQAGGRRAEAAEADDQYRRLAQQPLAVDADSAQDDMRSEDRHVGK